MRKNKFMAGLLVAVMLIAMLPVVIASAQEVVLYDEVFNNVYTNDDLSYNRYNNQVNDPEWLAGNIWAAPWGAYGNLRDAEDGSLAVIRGFTKGGVPVSGNETYFIKKIIADAIADNSTLEITYNFRTPEKVEYSGAQVWFRFASTNSSGISKTWCPFALKISGAGIEPVWAAIEFYPQGNKTVNGKKFDRDPNQLGFTWGKDYTVKITLKPDIYGGKNYRYVAEVWEDGDKIGTGIINEWSEITSDVIKTFTNVNFNMPTTDPITPEQEPEDLLYIKGIKLKAIQPDVPVNATYFPEDGCIDAAIDTDVYADFESPVNAVLKSQVTVDGGASVAEVAMGNDDKRVNITLDGVKANAAYTVKIKNVKGKNADSAFDYEWTFTTDGGTEFKAPYFGSSAVVIEADASDISLADAVALDNNAYLSGEEWGVKDSSCLANKDGYVWIKPGAEGLLAKKFTPIADGETLNLDAVIYVKAIGGSGTRAFLSSFGIEGEGAIRKLFCYHHNSYNQTVAVLYNSSEHRAWHQPKDDDTVVSTGTISSVDVNNGKWTEQETNNLLTFKQWPAPNTGKGTQYDGDLALNLTMSPTADGKYELVLTITGSRIEMVSKCTITKAEAMAFDTITLRGNTSAGYNDEGYIGIKSVSADKTLGKPYPVVGENTAMIPYTNLSGADFNADVFVVERDAETGKLVKATIINKENITGESGELECTFEAVEKGNKLDFYVLNDADSMILLSGKTTFEVGE